MDIFGVVVIVVSLVAATVSVLSYVRADRLYQRIGRLGGLWLDRSEDMPAETRDMIREEVRQMVDAISAERAQRGT